MYTVAVIVILLILWYTFGRRFGDRALKIESPSLGFLNLIGESALSLLQADRNVLEPLFGSSIVETENVPSCDVLFLYCIVNEGGSISEYHMGLREIISASDASVVIIASENNADNLIAASQGNGNGMANLVMTIERKGELFRSFYVRLFDKMYSGVSMPVAWVEIAPQNPNLKHEDCPDSLFLCELGQMVFEKASS